ncbi:hypothetical protein BDV30DRAFT_231024 [Aspergillus minisclerotigenes]|uniref:NmrA-like domain-containing protein n=1 Tax=Aspergillus minisclerotigenes TaxID=656917 RepID=A0A5N6IN15_9EURO|nr:hypothetical protein BDV30DRAFT_231024 [Aspergillus minisclerotigenes]
MSDLQSRRITLVGATGNLGSEILSALLASGIHHVSVIARPTTSKVFDDRVTVHHADFEDVPALTRCLEKKDVLIMALNPESYSKQIPLIRAAAEAQVRYIVPTEFGSDPTHETLNKEIFLARMQAPFRSLIEELGVSSWIGVVNGLFFDFNIRNGFWGLDLRNRKVMLYDDGQVKINTSTLSWVGASLARFFSMPEQFVRKHRNNWVFFSSFLVSQLDVFESAMRVTGTQEADWDVVKVNAEIAAEDAKKNMQQGDHMAIFSLLFALTFQEGFGSDFSHRLIDYQEMEMAAPCLDDVVKKLME